MTKQCSGCGMPFPLRFEYDESFMLEVFVGLFAGTCDWWCVQNLMSYCRLLFCVTGVFEQPSQADPQLSHRKWVRSSPDVELIIIMNTLIKHLMSR